MFLLKKKIGKRFILLRIAIFNALLIDYLAISLRTLGHFPQAKTKCFLDYLSFFLACFMLICIIFELLYMWAKINDVEFYTNELLSKRDKAIKGYYYDGMKPEILKVSWFARNYNFFFLLRFVVVCVMIFNMQYLQFIQVIGSLIVMLTFCILTFHYQLKFHFFSSRFTMIFRLIQEISMTIIVILINLFCFDAFFEFLGSSQKELFVLVLMILLILNIVLEIISSIISIIFLIKGSFKKKRRERKMGGILKLPQNQNPLKNSKPKMRGRISLQIGPRSYKNLMKNRLNLKKINEIRVRKGNLKPLVAKKLKESNEKFKKKYQNLKHRHRKSVDTSSKSTKKNGFNIWNKRQSVQLKIKVNANLGKKVEMKK